MLGRLTRRFPFPVDPDFLESQLQHLMVGVGFDASLLVRLDAHQMLRNRRKMMGILARHFRIPPTYWEGRDVVELQAWFTDMLELAAEERQEGVGVVEE